MSSGDYYLLGWLVILVLLALLVLLVRLVLLALLVRLDARLLIEV